MSSNAIHQQLLDRITSRKANIGVIGLGLDLAMRRLERLPAASWGYQTPAEAEAA